MDNPVSTGSHIALWLVVIGIGIFLTWSAVNKKSETDNYAKGSNHAEGHVTNYPFSFGCVPIDVMDSIRGKAEAKK